MTVNLRSASVAVATVSPATLLFTEDDWNTPRTVTVTAVNDAIDNLSDQRSVDIWHVPAAGTNFEGANERLPVVVTDDEALPEVAVGGSRMLEGDSGSATLVFTLNLSHGSEKEITVDYGDATTGSATVGTDYEALAMGTVTVTPGTTRARVGVTVTGDATAESDETVVLRFSSPVNATLQGGGSQLDATGTIVDDDSPVEVSIARTGTGSIEEGSEGVPGGRVEFTVRLSRELLAGERVDVPLVISGTGVSAEDLGPLMVKAGDGLNSGVSLEDGATLAPTVIFAGAGAQIATLEIEAIDDGADRDAPL